MVPALYANQLAGKNMDFANPRKTPENCAKDTTMNKEVRTHPSRTHPTCLPIRPLHAPSCPSPSRPLCLSVHGADCAAQPQTLNRIVRAKNAAANGFETLGFFGAGVVAANVAGVSVNRVNALSAGYVVSRVLYNFVYVFLQDNARYAPVRSLVWLAGMGISSALWILAGNKVA